MSASKDQFTDREIQILAAAFQCLKDPSALSLDYEKFAHLAGFKSIGGARNAFTAIKKKLSAGAASDSSPAATPQKKSTKNATPATPTQEDGESNDGAGVNDSDAADNEITPDGSPLQKPKAKVGRKPKTKKAAVKIEEEDDAEPVENDEDGTTSPAPVVKPKRKYTRKPKDPNAPPAKRAKKQAPPPTSNDEEEQEEQAKTHNGKDNTHKDDTASTFDTNKKAIIDEGDHNGGFGVQTTSQEQLAIENVLAPNAF